MGLLNLINYLKDQYLFDNLEDKEKLAFCRLISEIVKADNHVLSNEFKNLPDIPKAFMVNSGTITLDQAIEDLKSLKNKERSFLIKELIEVKNSDSYSSNKEEKILDEILKKLNS